MLETIKADGSCKGRTKINQGETVRWVVEIEDYSVELREYQGSFDAQTGKLT